MEILIIGLILVFMIVKVFSSGIKGAIGESKVAIRLDFLNKKEYKVFNNILLQSEGRSSQIDHLIVSVYGIFVIETKNYKGWIHGHENSEYWVQSFYKKKYRFRNPVPQNKGHIGTLKTILREYNHVVYYPIIVFTGQAKLKNVYSKVPVIYKGQLLRAIKNRKGKKILTVEEVNEIIRKIFKSHVRGKSAKGEHVRKARKNVYKQKRRENSSLCPRCGGSLVIRNGQYGKFYGCTNFPKCRYTKKLKRKII